MRTRMMNTTSKNNSTLNMNGTGAYAKLRVGYGIIPLKETYKKKAINRKRIPTAIDFPNEIHHGDIYTEPYKYFPVKEPLEFTHGFTERKNEMEVL